MVSDQPLAWKAVNLIKKETKEFTAEFAKNAEKKKLNNLCVLSDLCGEMLEMASYFIKFHMRCQDSTPWRLRPDTWHRLQAATKMRLKFKFVWVYLRVTIYDPSTVPRLFYQESKLLWANHAKFAKYLWRRHLRIWPGRGWGPHYAGNNLDIARIRSDILKIPDRNGDL